ncbi:hypothetical protein PTKIN_Ptkin17bG0139600 [Pterospermum kingtungense]
MVQLWSTHRAMLDPSDTGLLSFHCQERETRDKSTMNPTQCAGPVFQHLNAPTQVTSLRYQARRAGYMLRII